MLWHYADGPKRTRSENEYKQRALAADISVLITTATAAGAMNLKQAQTILSDLLMKCEEENIALPQDPLETIVEAIQSLRGEMKHEMRRSQMDMALDCMRTKYGLKPSVQPTHGVDQEKRKRAREFPGHKPQDQQRYMRPITTSSSFTNPRSSSNPSSTHSPVKKKTRLQDDVKSKPAARPENQKLVDALLQLGEYELRTGRSQRGVTRLRAAKQVRDTNEVITSGAQARRLEGVGASAAEKVDVMLKSGLKGALKEYGEEDAEEESEESGPSEEEVAGQHQQQKEKESSKVKKTRKLSQSRAHARRGDDEDEGDEEEEDEEGDQEEEEEEEYRDDDEDDKNEEEFYAPSAAKK